MAAFTPFYDWLAKHKGLRSPVGDLARDVLKDPQFPRDVTTLDALLTHIRGTDYGTAEVLAKARTTWRNFERGGR
jgi:uncharacterized protein YozE (UPF0346 family)